MQAHVLPRFAAALAVLTLSCLAQLPAQTSGTVTGFTVYPQPPLAPGTALVAGVPNTVHADLTFSWPCDPPGQMPAPNLQMKSAWGSSVLTLTDVKATAYPPVESGGICTMTMQATFTVTPPSGASGGSVMVDFDLTGTDMGFPAGVVAIRATTSITVL